MTIFSATDLALLCLCVLGGAIGGLADCCLIRGALAGPQGLGPIKARWPRTLSRIARRVFLAACAGAFVYLVLSGALLPTKAAQASAILLSMLAGFLFG